MGTVEGALAMGLEEDAQDSDMEEGTAEDMEEDSEVVTVEVMEEDSVEVTVEVTVEDMAGADTEDMGNKFLKKLSLSILSLYDSFAFGTLGMLSMKK